MEDLRVGELEHWGHKRNMKVAQNYSNLEKRTLRRWFEELDYDGSGEVNVEELQDPMLSSGILKTREQVVRILANVDKNNTQGIDFQEFLLALTANKLADKSKLKRLQEMSADPYFSVDTLITQERRRALFSTIVSQSQKRLLEVEKLVRKYDRKNTKELAFLREFEEMEERQTRSIFLHVKYATALERVLADKHEFYVQTQKQLKVEEERRKQLSEDLQNDLKLLSRPGHRTQSAKPIDALPTIAGLMSETSSPGGKLAQPSRLRRLLPAPIAVEKYTNPYSAYSRR